MIEDYKKKIDNLSQTEKKELLQNFPTISAIQEGIWLQYLQHPHSAAYNLGFLLKLETDTDKNRFVESIYNTISLNPIVRSFYYEDKLKQNVYIIPVNFAGLQNYEISHEKGIHSFVEQQYNMPFHLQTEIPLRVFQITCKSEIFFFFLFHHIAVDGRSLEIFKDNLIKNYIKPHNNIKNLAYFHFIENGKRFRQNSHLYAAALDEYLSYYKGFNPNYIEWELPERSIKSDKASFITYSFSKFNNESINNILHTYKCLPYSFFQMVLALALYKMKGIKKLIIGTTTENRLRENYQDGIGLFANTIAIKSHLNAEFSLVQLLKKIDEEFIRLISQPALSYKELVENLDLPVFHNSFQVVLECQRFTMKNDKTYFKELPIYSANRSAKFDLTIFVNINSNKEYSLIFESNSKKIAELEVNNILSCMHEVIQSLPILLHKNSFLTDIHSQENTLAATPAEKALESAETLISSEKSLREPSSETASNTGLADPARTTDTLAVITGEFALINNSLRQLINLMKGNQLIAIPGKNSISFDVLYNEALGIAKILNQHKASSIVAIEGKRDSQTVAMMLGVWLTQRKFMVISSRIPPTRRDAIREQTASDLIYYDPSGLLKFERYQMPYQEVKSYEAGYVMFTSGTTGVPKGVYINENSILNLLFTLDAVFKSADIQKVALNADYSFDAFIQQFIQLLSGRSIYVLTEEERLDINKMITVLNQLEIQQIDCTPSQLKLYFQENLFNKVPLLKLILVGGEPIGDDLLELIKKVPSKTFVNAYGPCEATVDVTLKVITPETSTNCIGKPIYNTRIGIIGEDKQVLHIEETGEIVIQGCALGEGYVKSQEGEGFTNLDLGFGVVPSYLTGDLGYIDAAGEIFIKGRKDSQIKRNGVRIELLEIESIARKIIFNAEEIKCVSLSKDKIVLFVQAKTTEISQEVVNSLLRSELPEYMLPDDIVLVDKFILNNSGKSNFKKMYSQYKNGIGLLNNLEQTSLTLNETRIARIWANSIGINLEKIGKFSTFFDVGGNSLLAFKVLKEMRKLNANISISYLLNRSTLEEISQMTLEQEKVDVRNFDKNIFSINNPDRTKHKLVLFHPLGGGISCYKYLAEYLEKYHIETIAVQDSFDSQSNLFKHIDDYAESITKSLIALGDEVHFIGWSFGGILAHAVATRFYKKNIHVKSLMMIDTFFNEETKKSDELNFGLQAIVNHICFERNISFVDVKHILEEEYHFLDHTARYHKVYEYLIKKGLINNLDFNAFKGVIDTSNHHRKLVGTFQPNTIDRFSIPINLIYANESLKKLELSLYNWGLTTTMPVREYRFDSNHYSIIKNKNMFSLVLSILNGELNEQNCHVA